MSTSQSSNKFRDSSFSSYLDGAEETFVLELRASKPDHIHLGRNTPTEDREIDVFDAKKYFNEGSNYAPIVNNKESPDKVSAIEDQPQIPTPSSVRSESSWNSGSAMSHSVLTTKNPIKIKRKSFLANIVCNCSCSDKNSVEIRDYNCSIKSGNNMVKTSDHSVKKSLSGYDTGAGFLESEKGKNCLSLDKKLSMLTWDALVPEVTEEIKIPSICIDLNNDSDSDASSDLFEIGSLSKGNSVLSRQASDGLSGCITPGYNYYAPSEASIEWSVVTASAADFSVFSDFEELRSTTATTTTTTSRRNTIQNPKKTEAFSRNSPIKELPKRRSGILSGCKSEKAVRVAGDAHRSHDKGLSNTRNLQKSNTFMQSKVPGLVLS